MTNETNTENSLTPEQVEALLAQLHGEGGSEATSEEATIHVSEDTADHVVN